MEKELLELRGKLTEKMGEINSLIDVREAREDRSYTEEEATKFEGLNAEANDLRSAIAVKEQEIEARKFNAKKVVEPRKSPEEKITENFSLTEAVRQAKSGNLKGIYKELNEEGVAQARSVGVELGEGGITLPEFALRADAQNTATAGTQPADGGNLIPKDRRGFIEHLYDQTIMSEAGVTMLNGLAGNVEMPTEASVVSAAWGGEIDDVESQKAGFGLQTMSPKRLAVVVAYSTQLLRQSTPSIDAVLRRQIDQAVAQELDNTFINGNSTYSITGLEDITGSESITTLTYADLVKIVKFQKTSNRNGNFKVISTPEVMAKLMDTYRNDQGTGAPLLEGDRLATGMGFLASNKVQADAGDGNDSQLYAGDFSDFYVGAWGGIQLIVDPYTRASAAQTRLVVNSFWDMHNTRPDKMLKETIAFA